MVFVLNKISIIIESQILQENKLQEIMYKGANKNLQKNKKYYRTKWLYNKIMGWTMAFEIMLQ